MKLRLLQRLFTIPSYSLGISLPPPQETLDSPRNKD